MSMPSFPVILIDVKYNQITTPVSWLIPQVKVIQLVRRDIERLYFSGELHTFYGRNPEAKAAGIVPQFIIDPVRMASVERDQAKYVREYQAFAGLRFFYEDLTDNRETEVMPEKYSRAVCEYLGIEVRELQTGTKKVAPSDVCLTSAVY